MACLTPTATILRHLQMGPEVHWYQNRHMEKVTETLHLAVGFTCGHHQCRGEKNLIVVKQLKKKKSCGSDYLAAAISKCD